ncbi:UvrD-helicase domain-containing protein [Bdellovibrio bacteriovorus]|uniref:DNA 3'-5' helicase n=1 Tax=Bdellovibrio bacteriovorus (strain ATCC 15356 / DSM 50701 / NCIMB 9529 / HD100) TaxID=264462 RepID=Q6MND7_BDEBA|nr:UvrD-helicase domain-containing protein [Bdellovibrio bacteriovorus]AHZ86527.1 ATP-dependent DNA helicase [Bdellovibrio bacteriovorus]BEV67770.1 ATP-dependent DNA helicase PcrA [Bdellovibrio bacteriovorus]CAE79215.1 ATP-dependent DNA helicase [Bdellovibrio bacteriovorus HD100]
MDWFKGLNPEQQKAVKHNFGPLLILAGAGSGKTTVLVSRTGRLISERVAQAQEICVLTFTNKAARELKHRVGAKLGSSGSGMWAGTFHSFGLQILRRFHKHAGLSPYFGIVDQSDCNAIVKDLIKDIKNSGKDKFDADKILNMINDRRTGMAPQTEAFDEYHEMVEVLTPKFTKRLEHLGVVDFEGLLIKPITLFKENPEILEKVQGMFTQVMVDEFQDTNRLQMDLIAQIVKSHNNIAVVGDDDQSIYGWRGAEVKNILNFPQEFTPCEVIKLERNYRSSAEILAVANAAISKNKNRHGKILRPQVAEDTGQLPELFILDREEDECEFVVTEILNFQRQGYSYKDMAVLYRSNTQGGLIESSLRRANVPYHISGGTSIFDRREIKDLMAYLKQALAPNEVSLRRIINVPSRGIGDTSIEKLSEFALKKRINFVDACRFWQEAGVQDKAGAAIDDLMMFIENLPKNILDFQVGSSPGAKMVQIFQDIGYREYVYGTAADPTSAEKKWMVVEILGRILDSFLGRRSYDVENIKSFVDCMLLRDDLSEEELENKVQLMTLHASKGLEFPVVILAGLEEDLLPHKNLGSDIDEERRLFYVGVTRAKKRLVMSRCQQRKKNGAVRPVAPSRFLLELPKELYTEFPLGARPVVGQEREDLVASFLSKLDSKLGTGKK